MIWYSHNFKAFGHGALATSIIKSSLQVGAGTIWPQEGYYSDLRRTTDVLQCSFSLSLQNCWKFTVKIKLIKPGCQLDNWCQRSVISVSLVQWKTPCRAPSTALHHQSASQASPARRRPLGAPEKLREVSAFLFGQSLLFVKPSKIPTELSLMT